MALPSIDDLLLAARALWGDPTERKQHEWRYGTHGSKSVRLDKLTWYDNEAQRGGGAIELCREAGITWDGGREHNSGQKSSTVQEQSAVHYAYRDESGTLLFEVLRYPKGHKPRFRQRRPDGRGGWEWKGPTRSVLYRLPELIAADPAETVWVPEGEKDVETLRRLGLLATCNPGGAGKWKAEYSIFLKGRDVVLMPDNDEAGRDHVAKVARALGDLPARIRLLALPGLAEKGDVSDWVEAGGDAETLLGLARAAGAPPPAGEEGAPSRGTRPEWFKLCLMSGGEHPTPLPVLENACLALEHDPHWAGKLSYDEMAACACIEGREVDDNANAIAQRWMQRAGLRRIGKDIVGQAIQHVARQRRVHPLRDYLEALVWDRAERVNRYAAEDVEERTGGWLTTYLGVERSRYASEIGRMFLIAMVARIFKPGCKADYMLVLEGPQGKLKSTACKVLAGEAYFSDHLPDLTAGKDASIHLQGKWLIEVAEMHAFSRAEATLLKSFLSRTTEQFRPPYGAYEIKMPRQCLFVGTSNKSEYLRDETGGRRFWPVVCGEIKIAALAADRDQLLAEAVYLFRDGAQHWPDAKFEAETIEPEQEKRYEFDPWYDLIKDIVDPDDPTPKQMSSTPPPPVTNKLIAERLGVKTDRFDPAIARRISACMRKLGWVAAHTKKGNIWEKTHQDTENDPG